MELAERKVLARAVCASLDGTSPAALRMFAQALRVAGGPLDEFANSFAYLADAVQYEDVEGGLAELKLARDLRIAARHPDCGELLDRLDGVEAPPWPQLVVAIERAREAA
jgi:hypothetical protein